MVAAWVLSVGRVEAGNHSVEVYAQVRPPDPSDPKQAGNAPGVDVTVIGGAKVSLEKFTLSTIHQNQKLTVKAERLRQYGEAVEPLSIALVIHIQNTWIDDDTCYERHPEVLDYIKSAIDKARLSQAPPGSQGVVVSYSAGAEVRVPMGDLKFVTGSALGTNKDYRGFGNDMVQGIRLGIAELSRGSTPRKALIVIGDGNDTNIEMAKGALEDLRSRAREHHIELFGIIYKDAISAEGNVITSMIPSARTVSSGEAIAVELGNIIARMADRYYLTFPGYDENTGIGLPWDGRDHSLVLTIDHADLDPFTLTLAPQWQPLRGGFAWIITSTIAASAMLLLIATWRLMRRSCR